MTALLLALVFYVFAVMVTAPRDLLRNNQAEILLEVKALRQQLERLQRPQ